MNRLSDLAVALLFLTTLGLLLAGLVAASATGDNTLLVLAVIAGGLALLVELGGVRSGRFRG